MFHNYFRPYIRLDDKTLEKYRIKINVENK